jgi:hypothetical protein
VFVLTFPAAVAANTEGTRFSRPVVEGENKPSLKLHRRRTCEQGLRKRSFNSYLSSARL